MDILGFDRLVIKVVDFVCFIFDLFISYPIDAFGNVFGDFERD